MELQVIHRPSSEEDLRIGYLDGKPAVGTADGAWYLVSGDAVIHTPSDRLVWFLKFDHGVWECIHDMHWQDQYVDPVEKWIKKTPDYKEPGR